MRENADRIAYIDGWRAIAIALVLLDHLAMNREIGAFYATSRLGLLSEYGEVGVFIFFFISGYVVSGASLREAAETGAFSAQGFYLRRFFRIVPPLTLYLCVCLALGAANVIGFSAVNFFSSALYLCNSTAPHVSCNWYVGHTWSLAFEEQFYLLFPLVFSFLEFRAKPNPIAAAGAILVAAIPLIFTLWWIGKTGFFVAYALFFAGYAAAKHGARVIDFIGPYRSAALIAAAVIAFMPRSFIASFGADEGARADLLAYYRLLHVVAIPALVLLTGRVAMSRRVLSNRALAHFGRASYSIYLWQQLFNGPPFDDLCAASQIALLAAMAAVCAALYEWLETPLIEKGRALSRALRTSRVATFEGAPAPGAILEPE
jgi:peptidoglycan/LPS O-acetylase OafA/YrhL